MTDREKVIKGLEEVDAYFHRMTEVCYRGDEATFCDLKEKVANAITMLKEQEAVEPTINEDGEAYCICGENVGIIPNSKSLPSVRLKYCPECGRRMKWE